MKGPPKKPLVSVLAYENIVQNVKITTQVSIEKMDPSDDEELRELVSNMRNMNVGRCERLVFDAKLYKEDPSSMGYRQCRNRKPKGSNLYFIAKIRKHVCDSHMKQYDTANEDHDYERINSWKWIHE